MRKQYAVVLMGIVSTIAACSTPTSRINDRPAVFAGYPSEIQEKIRAGDVAIGFTTEQVELSLGKPDRVFTNETEGGRVEVWAYSKSRSAFSFGLGAFSGGSTSVGGGVGVGNDAGEDRIRVSFSGGRVSGIERAATR